MRLVFSANAPCAQALVLVGDPPDAFYQEVGRRSVAVRMYVVDLEEGWSQAPTTRARSWDEVTCMSMPCSASEGGERCPLSPPPPWAFMTPPPP
jgi:hypothetical protein